MKFLDKWPDLFMIMILGQLLVNGTLDGLVEGLELVAS